jgi:general secretion pathway protein A
MYLSHYNLLEKPFQITSDPRFLWLGEKHQEALATLRYGVLDKKGFLLLTGDVGTGKTTLIKTLLRQLDHDTIVATVVDPRLEKLEFFNFLAEVFEIESRFSKKVDFLSRFTRFLNSAHSNDKTVLLIIDEAQELSRELLEEIRLLSNIEKEDSKLLNIFFVGQNEFNKMLTENWCRALRQRITITYQIKPLTEAETGEYVRHRLKIAGTEKEIFRKKSIREIYAFSYGYPRLINIICDHALLTGYVRDLESITPTVVRECAKELTLPGEKRLNQLPLLLTMPRKRKKFLLRPAFYAGLMFVVASCWYLATTGHKDYIKDARDYYGRFFGSPERTSTKNEITKTEAPESEHLQMHRTVTAAQARDTMLPQLAGDDTHQDLPARSWQAGTSGNDNTNRILADNTDTLDANPVGGVFTEEDITEAGGPNPAKNSDAPIFSADFNLIVPFNYDTNELLPKAYGDLDRLAAAMSQNLDIEIVVKGYTDTLGGRHYNKKLSEFRANIVKSYLVAKGTSPLRIRAIGMGGESPREPNATSAGRAANRRVEIEIQTGGT